MRDRIRLSAQETRSPHRSATQGVKPGLVRFKTDYLAGEPGLTGGTGKRCGDVPTFVEPFGKPFTAGMIQSEFRNGFASGPSQDDLPEMKQRALLDFRAQLAQCRLRLIQQLGIANILSGTIREQVVRAFAQELETVQYHFLQTTADLREAIQAEAVRTAVAQGFNPTAVVAGAAGAGAGLAGTHAAGIIVVDQVVNGMFWWKHITDVCVAAKIAALLGISLGHAAILVGLLAGAPVFMLTRKLMSPLIARLLRRLIVRSYDERVQPELMAWARRQLGEEAA